MSVPDSWYWGIVLTCKQTLYFSLKRGPTYVVTNFYIGSILIANEVHLKLASNIDLEYEKKAK